MRGPIRDYSRLQHILEQIDAIEEYVKNNTYDNLVNNKIDQYGLVKCIEIIGEAAYKLSIGFKETHTEVNWEQMVKMRHVLVHGYYHITIPIVWETAAKDIPALRKHIEHYISELESNKSQI